MRLVKIGTAAVSVKVGDFAGNAARLREAMAAARAQGVHLLVTPELGISGYSLEDRIYWPDIARESWAALQELAVSCGDLAAFLGLPVRMNGNIFNAAAFIAGGRVRGLILKRHLPTYSVFYEGRNWTAWHGGVTECQGVPAGDLVFRLPWGMVTAEICEDLWSVASPARDRVRAGAEIVCNPSASPFTPRKNELRKQLILGAAATMKSVYAYANLLGSDNSRLVFDGGGIVATPEGIVAEGPILDVRPWTLATGMVDLDDISRMRAENTTWREDMGEPDAGATATVSVEDVDYHAPRTALFAATLPEDFYAPAPAVQTAPGRDRHLDELFEGLVLGLRDYYEKVGAFERFLVALSGGRDSALCLLIAVAAAKAFQAGAGAQHFARHVHAAYLPNRRYSSAATEAAARALAEELGVPFRVLAIDGETHVAQQFTEELAGGADKVSALARQNLQARIRGAVMLNWANSVGGLVLVTSNLSEAAVGYTTTGGDNEGGFSPIANLPKTLVSRLLEYLARRDGIAALEKVLAIPPSAELAPDQLDEADLMPYVVLDDLLYLYARKRLLLADCWRLLCARHPQHAPEQLRTWTADFARRFAQSQWKRDQHPVSLKVMDLDLDPKTGFRFPVTQSIAHELAALQAATLD